MLLDSTIGVLAARQRRDLSVGFITDPEHRDKIMVTAGWHWIRNTVASNRMLVNRARPGVSYRQVERCFSQSNSRLRKQLGSVMISFTVVALLAACSGTAPTGVEGSAKATSEPDLMVAPNAVWLSVGESAKLIAWLPSGERSDDGASVFEWSTSDPAVVQISASGELKAVGRGTATISVSAEGPGRVGPYVRERATSVTVTDEAQEALIYKILGIPASVAETWPSLAYTAEYDSVFAKWGEHHWERGAGVWERTYYDRGLAWYAAWARTGDAKYLERGHTDVTAYRDDYVLKNDGAATPKWVFPEGLAIHYILTGDSVSALAVAKMADAMVRFKWLDTMTDPDFRWVDGRTQGRAVLVQLIAYLIDAPPIRDWKYETDRGIQAILDWHTMNGDNGAWKMASYCGGQAHFQVSHALLEVLIRYYDLVDPRQEIPPVVKKSLDYIWQDWNPDARAFAYMDIECEGVGTTEPATDLDLLMVWPFGWYYKWSGDDLYRQHGDEVFEGGLAVTWWSGTKQFNQSFMRSYRYPFYR